MKYKAYAKINLTLDVVGKRNDGYHDMDMIMVPISLYDVLDVSFSERDTIVCGTAHFPLDESNTIYKAIALMREAYGIQAHFSVQVEKAIPMQAGLAGGSSDAAAMLRAIKDMCCLPMSEEELLVMGARIGADVPFCLANTPARVQGIGDIITPFDMSMEDIHIVLVKPRGGVSTKEAFAGIDFTTCVHPDIEACQQALIKHDYDAFCASVGNTLEESAVKITPIIKNIKSSLQEYGFDCVLLSGSGSTLFALTRNETLAKDAVKELKKEYKFACKCNIWRGK